jgi:hypothetical protein
MNGNNIPKPVRDKLLTLNAQFEHLVEKGRRTNDAINNARARLTGKFENDQQYEDTYSTLKKLVADQPIIEQKRRAAERTFEECQAWLDALPDDVTLEVVKPKPHGSDLHGIREQIKNAQDELAELSGMTVPSADIGERVKAYVAGLGRPKVSGVGDRDKLQVSWPSDSAVALHAILEPEKMVAVIRKEIERAASDPLPLDQRRKRIAELRRTIDELQRQAFALGDNPYSLDPAIILGVRVVRRETVKKVERRMSAVRA